ncbi:MAG: hypothetical protein JXA10_14080 [Anaerolineae bacterium]|nr:hypothetical protein [Anaerolineae bacterium]
MPDQHGYLLPGERQILLQQYAPVLVLFPEDPAKAPYPDEGDAIYTVRGTYHPRAAEFFLAHGKICYKRSFTAQTSARSYQDEIADVQQSITDSDITQIVNNPNAEYHHDPYFTGLTGDDLRAAIRRRLVQIRLSERIRGFDRPLPHDKNIDQWRQYFKFLAHDDPLVKRSVVYGRLVQGRAPLNDSLAATEKLLKQGPVVGPYDVECTRIALQYWSQYVYDDWANRHEGDWESITLLVELSNDAIRQNRELDAADLLRDIQVLDVGYAAHEDGFRRLWRDVQKTAGDERPLVYVGRGSQASYFAWQPNGYPASARVSQIEQLLLLPGKIFGARRFLGRRWDTRYAAHFTSRDPKTVDWVAVDPDPTDRVDPSLNLVEQMVPPACRGVRRVPDFGPAAGQDDATYHLETDDLFWLEMVQEYGMQWGEDTALPGGKGPGGISRAERDKSRADIHQLGLLETAIELTLQALSTIRVKESDEIPELNVAMRRLRPGELQRQKCFPKRIQSEVYTMWARILYSHPKAWQNGPPPRLKFKFRRIIYSGIRSFIRGKPEPDPLLKRSDPIFHLKSLLAQVRRIRYEIQHEGSKWDNPFAWVRYICRPDVSYYGLSHGTMDRADLLLLLDCVDDDLSMG